LGAYFLPLNFFKPNNISSTKNNSTLSSRMTRCVFSKRKKYTVAPEELIKPDKYGKTKLVRIILENKKNALSQCKELLRQGACVHGYNPMSGPYTLAEKHSPKQIYDFIPDIETFNECYQYQCISPLTAAVATNNIAIIKVLCRHGALQKINAKDCCGRTPLMLASQLGHVEAVHCILDRLNLNDLAETFTGLTVSKKNAYALALFAEKYECAEIIKTWTEVQQASRDNTQPLTTISKEEHAPHPSLRNTR
jgi:ankyrin repeat protein